MIVFFEGFETVGTETGLANQATTRPRIHKRWTDTASGGIPSTDSYYLIDDAFSEGFAINMGTNSFSTSNSLYLTLPVERQDAPGLLHREWIIGFRIHVPKDPNETFDFFLINGLFGGTNPTSVLGFQISNSADLIVIRGNPGQFTIATVTGAFTPGGWHYFETRVKIAEAAHVVRLSTFTGTVTSGNYKLNITIPSLGVSEFSTANIAYNATASTVATAIDTASPAEVPNGFLNVTQSGSAGLSDGYLDITADDNLEFMVEIENVSLVGGDVGAVISAEGGFVEVRINGTEVVNEHQVDTNNALTTGIEELEFGNAAVGAADPDNFVGYDDFYVMDCSEAPNQDFLGSVRVRSIPPNTDVYSEWVNSSASGDNYPHIDENGASSADYVETDVNAALDRYAVTNPTEDDLVIAVKIEMEATNETGGSPSIFIQAVSGASIDEQEHVITNTTSYDLLTMYVQDDPAGGAWSQSSINALQVGMTFQNNVS